MQTTTPSQIGIGPIGLDIGERTIRAVQVRHEGAGVRLHAAVCASRAEPGRALSETEMARMARILDRQGFEGVDVALGLPDDRLLSNTFEQVGQGAGAPMDVVSRVELARGAGCAPPQLETVCWPLPAPARARQSTHVMAVGCLHTEADALLDAVESAGLRALALEPRTVALARACEPLIAGKQGICGIVDVGWDGATAVVVYQGAIVYHRFMAELGVGVLSQALVSGLGADEQLAAHLLLGRSALAGPGEGGPRLGLRADASRLMDEHASRLAHELGLSLSYASHWYAQPQVDVVLLTGEGAAMPGLVAATGRDVGAEARIVTVQTTSARPGPEWGPGGPPAGAELMTALGLAMR